MISEELEFYAPATADEVIALLARHKHDLIKLLAGGMSLVPAMNLGVATPGVVVSLNRVEELQYVRETESSIVIGSMTRHATIANHGLIAQWLPLLAYAASKIGDVQVRNRGTIGGSVVHAEPGADYLPTLAALGAQFSLRSGAGERTVDAAEFFVDLLQTAIEPDELLMRIEVPKPIKSGGWGYQRLSRIEGGYPIASAAAVIRAPGSLVVGIGGVCRQPVVLQTDASKLRSEQGVAEIGAMSYERCADAFGDVNGDAQYRRNMARVCVQRAVQDASRRSAD